jgi:hypothetical protein
MKPISFVLQPPRQRRHQALFDQDLPFRGRAEKSRISYNRKVKHKQREQE